MSNSLPYPLSGSVVRRMALIMISACLGVLTLLTNVEVIRNTKAYEQAGPCGSVTSSDGGECVLYQSATVSSIQPEPHGQEEPLWWQVIVTTTDNTVYTLEFENPVGNNQFMRQLKTGAAIDLEIWRGETMTLTFNRVEVHLQPAPHVSMVIGLLINLFILMLLSWLLLEWTVSRKAGIDVRREKNHFLFISFWVFGGIAGLLVSTYTFELRWLLLAYLPLTPLLMLRVCSWRIQAKYA